MSKFKQPPLKEIRDKINLIGMNTVVILCDVGEKTPYKWMYDYNHKTYQKIIKSHWKMINYFLDGLIDENGDVREQ